MYHLLIAISEVQNFHMDNKQNLQGYLDMTIIIMTVSFYDETNHIRTKMSTFVHSSKTTTTPRLLLIKLFHNVTIPHTHF